MIILSKFIHFKICYSLLFFFFVTHVWGQHSIGIENRVNRFDVYTGATYTYTFGFNGKLGGAVYTGLRNGPFSRTIHPAISFNYTQKLWTFGETLTSHIGISNFNSQLKLGSSQDRVYTTEVNLFLGLTYGKKYQFNFDLGFGFGKEYYSLGSYVFKNFLGNLAFSYVL